MGVGLTRDGIGARARTRPSREARDCEVEAVPEQVHGARLAVEPAAELLEDGVRPVEDSSEATNRVVVPGRMLGVLTKRGLHRDPERLLLDRDVNAEVAERVVQGSVEAGDRQAA